MADHSDKGRGYIPTGRTIETRGEGIYLQGGPLRQGERIYNYMADHSDKGTGYIPTWRTTQTRGEGILPSGRPSARALLPAVAPPPPEMHRGDLSVKSRRPRARRTQLQVTNTRSIFKVCCTLY
eukprot:4627075-Pyramimonas_sp.AAC.1